MTAPTLTEVATIAGILVIGGRIALAVDTWVHGRTDTSKKVEHLERVVARIQKQASVRWSLVNKKVGNIELDMRELKVKMEQFVRPTSSRLDDRPRGNGDDRSRK